MGPKAETYTFNQVKELLQMHENTLLNGFNSTIDRLDKKINILKEENTKIKKELTDLGESVQYHSDNVDEVNKKLEDIDSRVEEIKLDEITESSVTKTKKKLADLEDEIMCILMGFKSKPMKNGGKVKAFIYSFIYLFFI